jgi:16S rRNA (guanine(527)-N(7))-methyltransferase GidB
MIELFDRALKKLDIELSDEQDTMFDLFESELALFNPVYKLVKYEDEEELVLKHFVDCLAPLKTIKSLLRSGDTIADLGAGAGFPGLVLAIMLPDHQFYLVERMKRRTDFLANVIARTGLKNVTVLPEEAEKLNKKFNFVTCRAFHPLFDILGAVDSILEEGGIFCAYKGQRSYLKSELEMVESLPYSSQIVSVNVPYLDEERCLCIMKRT